MRQSRRSARSNVGRGWSRSIRSQLKCDLWRMQIRSDQIGLSLPSQPPTPLHVCDGYCAHAADAGGFGQSSWKQRSTQEVRGIGVDEPYVQIGQIRPDHADQIGLSLPSPRVSDTWQIIY